jgi:tRNA (guanine37-N1)-methyltransferase
VYLTPAGRLFDQNRAQRLSQKDTLILICGRYEGIDQRIIDLYVDEEISVGDYVLSSGEVAALTVVDATYRLIEGVITDESLVEESFNAGQENPAGCFLLEYPQWTRPEVYAGLATPSILLGGHHAKIHEWRLEKSIEKTLRMRPELIDQGKVAGVFNAETLRVIDKVRENLYSEENRTIKLEE